MLSAFELAEQHQRKVGLVSDRATARALKAWSLMDFRNLDASWLNIGPAVSSLATAAQVSAATTSNSYIGSASTSYGNTGATDLVNPFAFAGIDGSGRDVSGLLGGSVKATKQSIAAGLSEAQSMLSGATYLAAMMKTAIHDISRSSDLTGMTSHKYTSYVRVVQAGACSRCAVLAGIASSKRAFLRHPACKCSTFPVEHEEDVPKGFHDSTASYFASLSKDQQDKVFTKAGAEAIRAGADPTAVVTARRGASGISYGHGIGNRSAANSGRRMVRSVIGRNADGTPIMGYVTNEGNTIRGSFNKLNGRVGNNQRINARGRQVADKRTRLMPESIIPLTDDPELRIVLLRDAGYLDIPIAEQIRDPGARIRVAAEDRAIANQFYQHLGIQLG